VTQLVEGKARAGSIRDAMHLAVGKMMMQRVDIDGVHAVTSANALHYAFRMSGRAEAPVLTRLFSISAEGTRTVLRLWPARSDLTVS
jgi:hypothetical protein